MRDKDMPDTGERPAGVPDRTTIRTVDLRSRPARADQRSDGELIQATRDGDQRAYEELFRRHRSNALGLASRYAWEQADREDIVSQAFTDIYQAMRNGRGPVEAFRPYLLTCVRRLGAAHVSRMVRPVESIGEEAEQLPDLYTRTPEDSIEDQMVLAAFAELPERWRVALWHAVVEDEDPATIARTLGLNVNAANALIHRAKEGLRLGFLAQHLAAGEAPACGIKREQLAGLMRERLTPRVASEVRGHVETCPECQARLSEMAPVDQAMRAVVAPAVLGVPLVAYQEGVRNATGGLWAWLTSHVPQVVAAGVVAAGVTAAVLLWPSPPVPDAVPPASATPSAQVAAPAVPEPSDLAATSVLPETSAVESAEPTASPATTAPVPSPTPSPVTLVRTDAGMLAQDSFGVYNPGDAAVLEIATQLGEDGELHVVLPKYTVVDTGALADTCQAMSDTHVVCAAPGRVAAYDIPVLISASAPRGGALPGGTATLRSAGGTVVGPITLELTIPTDPC